MQTKIKDQSILNQFRYPIGVQGRAVAALMNQGHSALSAWGLKKTRIKPRFVILDVGCGGGKNIDRLSQLAFQGRVFGIDYSKEMVKYSRETNRSLITQNQAEIVQSSVEKICFPENSFDLVTAIETYYFWLNLPDTIREIKRVLKPKKNLLIINEMIKNGVYEVEHAETIMKTHVQLLTLHEIQYILQSAGFVHVKTFTKTKSPWNAILAQKP